jgi:hypothetical protein
MRTGSSQKDTYLHMISSDQIAKKATIVDFLNRPLGTPLLMRDGDT